MQTNSLMAKDLYSIAHWSLEDGKEHAVLRNGNPYDLMQAMLLFNAVRSFIVCLPSICN